jgi:hypothetical protein
MFPVYLSLIATVIGIYFIRHQVIRIHSRKRLEAIRKLSCKPGDFYSVGRYTCGHPFIDKPVDITEVTLNNDCLTIYRTDDYTIPRRLSCIPTSYIRNISVEGAASVLRRPDVQKMRNYVGFAFDWKPKAYELSYLIIAWNDGCFDHETIFELTGEGSFNYSRVLEEAISSWFETRPQTIIDTLPGCLAMAKDVQRVSA